MKMLIYVCDPVTDLPGVLIGELLARKLTADVTLLNIGSKKKKKKREKEEGKAILDQVLDHFEGLNVKTRVRRGKIAFKILQEVEENLHDIVVVTASRIGSLARVSSVEREILPKMPGCTLIVKKPQQEINRILMLTGGLQVSESMIEIGARFARALESKVTLMHVAANVPSMYTGLDIIEETLEEMLQTDTPIARHLRRCAKLLDDYQIPSEIKLRHGEPVYEIVREVDRENYDFVIIGASGARIGFREWFLRNVTEEVIDTVGVPVMVVNQAHTLENQFDAM
jgi:nucleotide-binding universal stress UspA family protein